MRALVVYESMFGNTRDVALAIADGIATLMPVETIDVGQAPTEVPPDVTLMVVGGPTHGHGMSNPSTRADAARRAEDRLVTRGIGIREWLEALRPGAGSVTVATFDTRIKGPELLWGAASKGAAKALRAAGFTRPLPPRSFLVEGPTGPVFDRLARGELDRARDWGASLASGVAQPAPGG